jgi:hypothetical protein
VSRSHIHRLWLLIANIENSYPRGPQSIDPHCTHYSLCHIRPSSLVSSPAPATSHQMPATVYRPSSPSASGHRCLSRLVKRHWWKRLSRWRWDGRLGRWWLGRRNRRVCRWNTSWWDGRLGRYRRRCWHGWADRLGRRQRAIHKRRDDQRLPDLDGIWVSQAICGHDLFDCRPKVLCKGAKCIASLNNIEPCRCRRWDEQAGIVGRSRINIKGWRWSDVEDGGGSGARNSRLRWLAGTECACQDAETCAME